MIIKPNNNNKLLLNKLDIFIDNKDKSGIHILYNIIYNKIYIGRRLVRRPTNLRRRFMDYYNINYLNREVKNGNSRIYKALLIYGYINFSLEILEYCDKKSIAEREQYYIYLFQPEYNIRCKSGKVYKLF